MHLRGIRQRRIAEAESLAPLRISVDATAVPAAGGADRQGRLPADLEVSSGR
jgi:hypothetical protein